MPREGGGGTGKYIVHSTKVEERTPATLCMDDVRGFAKLKKIQKKLDRVHPTHPPTPSKFFLETHHWHGQNTQIIITNNF